MSVKVFFHNVFGLHCWHYTGLTKWIRPECHGIKGPRTIGFIDRCCICKQSKAFMSNGW